MSARDIADELRAARAFVVAIEEASCLVFDAGITRGVSVTLLLCEGRERVKQLECEHMNAHSVAAHEELKLADERWLALTLVGVQHIAADETGPAEDLELRNCSCGSTLARRMVLDDQPF